jgi:UDP-N-acetylmuramoylalanine--D-glutamate ligase
MNTTIVVGLGKTGFSCVRHLRQHGHAVAVIDSRSEPPYLQQLRQQYPDVPCVVGANNDAAEFVQVKELVVSPGVSLRDPMLQPYLARGITAIGDIELFLRSATAPIVAISGANGKSTVTTLVGLMAKEAGLKVKVGGNLGEPALDLLDDQAELYVLELSSFQLETIVSLRAAAAVVLNITPDHMDRYRDFAEYCQAKWRIYNGCKVAVINLDNPISYSGATLPPKIIKFSLQKQQDRDQQNQADNFYLSDGALFYDNKKLLFINELKIKGRHQVANVLAALALGSAVNLPCAAMVKTLKEFSGLEHRCQWVRELHGVTWYNDSKGTNVGATQASIEGLGEEISGKVILILGGQGKGADFSPLCKSLTQYVKTLILIGQDAPVIKKTLHGCCKICDAASMREAILQAQKEAVSGDVVLLSPACASFDMFNNFEHRGQVFMEEVNRL